MKKIELTQGLSYSTGKFSAKKAVPIMVEDEQAEALIATGRFKLLEDVEEPAAAGQGTDINKMGSTELRVYAEELGIDVSACKNKQQVIDLITAGKQETEATPSYE